jgi:hypothetical protein
MDTASRPLLERVYACAERMRSETGKEPFLVYLGSAERSKAVAEIFRKDGLAVHVSPREHFVMVEGSPAAPLCERRSEAAVQNPGGSERRLCDRLRWGQQPAQLVPA